MPLTHVCMWTDKGWKHITAEEISHIHPGGSVSAKSGLFICDLCGQYVSLTNGEKRKRYFKHSKNEEDKNCPERVEGLGINPMFHVPTHELPIRIKIVTNQLFSLEMGFLAVPNNLIGKRDSQKIIIVTGEKNKKQFVYSFMRLNKDKITYLPIGNKPAPAYKIIINPSDKKLRQYWPATVTGITDGAIFDKSTGKKLPKDADIQVGKKYYILTKKRYIKWNNVHLKEVCVTNFSWKIYEVVVNTMDEETVRFFLDYHCRLTERPVQFYPLWPIYVESSHLLLHKSNDIKMFFQGNATPKMFPQKCLQKIRSGKATILHFESSERQQMISAERSNILEYIYLWKNQLDYVGKEPTIKVKDIVNKALEPGYQKELPKDNMLVVQAPVDGKVILKRNNKIVNIYFLQSDHRVIVAGLSWGMTIEVLQGLDCAWEAHYVKEKNLIDSSKEKELLIKLRQARGNLVPVSHVEGALANKMTTYPEIKKWLYKKIRDGYIEKKALLILKKTFGERG